MDIFLLGSRKILDFWFGFDLEVNPRGGSPMHESACCCTSRLGFLHYIVLYFFCKQQMVYLVSNLELIYDYNSNCLPAPIPASVCLRPSA